MGTHILNWGIHRGTLMSRDVGEPYKFQTEKECIEKAEDLKEQFANLGYKIWYANIKYPDGTFKEIMSNSYE